MGKLALTAADSSSLAAPPPPLLPDALSALADWDADYAQPRPPAPALSAASFARLFADTEDFCPDHRPLSRHRSLPLIPARQREAQFRRLVAELNALLAEQRQHCRQRFEEPEKLLPSTAALGTRSTSAQNLAGRRLKPAIRGSTSAYAVAAPIRPVSPSIFPPSPKLHCRLGHRWRSAGLLDARPAPPSPPKQPDPFRLGVGAVPIPAATSLLCLDMGQRLARQDVDEGVRLYHLQKHEEAVGRWRAALRRLRTPEDRFITMGYLAQAFCESGAYQDMLAFSLQQIELGNAQEDSYMRAEAFLNLARANERLCQFHKAVQYGRHSLENQSMDPRTPGYAYLCIGSAFLGFSNFQLALDHFEQAMRVANATQDRLLELQICVALGSLFTQLKDLSKAVVFLKNALGLLKTVSIVDVQAKYRSLVLYQLSVALRRKGAITDAKQAAEEALRLAAENGNRPIQGRCLHALGDIHREYRDVDKTWSRYEAGLALLEELEDGLGQLGVLASMAKTALLLQRPNQQHCECQAIQLNKRCLDLAKHIGCKLGMLKAHGRLCQIYTGLQDEESEEVARKAATGLTQEMELFCNFCGQRYALGDNSLQALPCSHIFHEKCLQTYLSGREGKDCPKCEHRAATLASLPSTSVQPPAMPSPHPRVVLLAEEEGRHLGGQFPDHSAPSPPPLDLCRIGTRSPSLDDQRPPLLRLDEAREERGDAIQEVPSEPSSGLHALATFKPIPSALKHQDTGFASSSPASSTATLTRPPKPPATAKSKSYTVTEV